MYAAVPRTGDSEMKKECSDGMSDRSECSKNSENVSSLEHISFEPSAKPINDEGPELFAAGETNGEL